ncbi:MAG: methylmalonyl-CoA mutase family protein [bacterium]|nr:methylmalonyl-CoA mutase family protein [bacterium]
MADRKQKFETISGLPVKELYTEKDLDKTSPPSVPGEYPFTRGLHKTMYRGRLWTMRQYAGFGTAKEANARYRYLLSQGTTGLSVAFDLPTQMGRDSDHPIVKGEVGKVGVAISSVEDMKILMQNIPLDKVSVSMTINATASILLSFILVAAEESGIKWKDLQGTIQNDVLKEYIARGTYIYPPEYALKIITDIFEFCSQEVPEWNTISISGYHIREAGSTAVEEVAFTLADGIAYVDAAIKKGLKVDDFAPRLAFFFNCHNNFLEEVAKFRAARRLWAKIMKERFGAKDPRSLMLRFHTQTAGSSLTAQQPSNNIVRTTLQALAAVLGGTQSLHTNSFDEALGLPTEESALIALRTQQVIANESGVADSADPLGGSFLVESFTDRIEKLSLELIEKIDLIGGMVKAIDEGFPQRCIQKSAYDYQKKVENQEEIVVGVNTNISNSEVSVPVLRIDESGEKDQVSRLTALKKNRDNEAVKIALTNLDLACKNNKNLMPLIVEAARKRATLGEISDVMRNIFGEYRERLTL